MINTYPWKRTITAAVVVGLGACAIGPAYAQGGRLLATSAVTEVGGSTGGGVVPWAVIAGYGTEDEIGGSATATYVTVPNYSLNMLGAAVGIYNRFEVSVARQNLNVGLGGLNPGLGLGTQTIGMDILGLKARLFGDILYTPYPQVAVGVKYMKNRDYADSVFGPGIGIPLALGAAHDSGTDFYVAATKAFLDGLFHHVTLVNLTVRGTKANALGLLGFGTDSSKGLASGFGTQSDDSYHVQLEGSAAVFLRPDVAIGAEFRQQPNNMKYPVDSTLTTIGSPGTIKDVFIAYFPNKNLSLTAAYADLGPLPFQKSNKGLYLSLNATF